jgi:hypothetical protein
VELVRYDTVPGERKEDGCCPHETGEEKPVDSVNPANIEIGNGDWFWN